MKYPPMMRELVAVTAVAISFTPTDSKKPATEDEVLIKAEQIVADLIKKDVDEHRKLKPKENWTEESSATAILAVLYERRRKMHAKLMTMG